MKEIKILFAACGGRNTKGSRYWYRVCIEIELTHASLLVLIYDPNLVEVEAFDVWHGAQNICYCLTFRIILRVKHSTEFIFVKFRAPS